MADEPVATVSVTIVLHNSERELARCLSAVRPEIESGFAELIAVDNASPDQSVAVVERQLPGSMIVRSPENRGFAAGANMAWPHVNGRYWLLLNPDAELEKGGIRALARWMDQHPAIGAASAELTDELGASSCSAGRSLPSPGRALFEASRLHRLLPAGLRGRILRGTYWRGGDQLDAGWVPGTAMIVRRTAVETVGLLDERFFLYGEDIDWCWRMRQRGWSIGVCSGVRARHREASSSGRTFSAEEFHQRMICGEIEAVRKARGGRYAGFYARAVALGLKLESLHPGREPQRRERAGAAARLWRRAAKGRRAT
jgi:N-acetylglucosaminyl-diphospho-decaprenol L-rhamnosyltransferase